MLKKEFNSWLKWLRSGKVIQGKGKLCQINEDSGELEYCCLGVYLDKVKKIPKVKMKNKSLYRFMQQTENLPASIVKKDFYDYHGQHINYGKNLATLNDEGNSFEKIANILKVEPETYVKKEW